MSARNIYEISTIITQEQRFAFILPDFLVNPCINKFLENVLIMHKTLENTMTTQKLNDLMS